MVKVVKVPGRPKGKARPRFANGHTYTPKTTREYERLIGSEYLAQDGRKYAGKVAVTVEAVFKVPVSWSAKRRMAVARSGERPTIRPDIDNIVKVVMDGLNGIAYEDDAQIVQVTASKVYDLGYEGLLITLEELDG